MSWFRRRGPEAPPAPEPPQPESEVPSPEVQIVEIFLDEYASLFTEVEFSWDNVNKAKKTFEETAAPRRQDALIMEDGRITKHYVGVDYGNRKARREGKYDTDPRSTIAQHSHVAYKFVRSKASPLLEPFIQQPALDGPTLHTISEDILGTDTEVVRSFNANRLVHAAGAGMEAAEHAESLMGAAYFHASVAQYVGERKVELFLSRDSIVFPFVERLSRLAAEGPGENSEFPGLVEMMATHVAQSQLLSQKDVLEQAVERATFTAYPAEAFVRDVVLGDWSERYRSTPFAAIAASAQAIATAVSLDEKSSGITKAEIARRISLRFGIMPSEWSEAYEAAAQARAVAALKGVRTLLKPFSRQGRLASNYRGRALANTSHVPHQGSTQQAGKKRSRQNTRSSPGTEVTLDMNDIVRQRPEAEPVAAFAILKGVGKTSGNSYTLEPVKTFEDLMSTPPVTKFLKKYKDMGDVLRSFLAQVAQDPGNDGVGFMHDGFKIHDESGQGRRHQLMRFSALQNTSEEGSKHPLAQRVRIVFGICEVNGVRHLAIKDIFIRNPKSYNR